MIHVRNLWHHYGVRPILKNISFSVNAGDVVSVMGPNGMGKSTLLAILGGVLSPIKGEVEIGGRIRRRSIEEEQEIRRKVVYLPDTPYLPSNRTGREFLLSVGLLYDVEDFHLMEHVDRLLDLFDLAEKGDSLINTYSTGQKKKIGLCSALVSEAPVLILDEPFSGGLDSAALLTLGKIMKALADRNDVTVVMAVPVPELVESLVDKVAILSHGELVAFDTPAEIRKKAGAEATFAEALDRIASPDKVSVLEKYIEERRGS